MPTREADLIAAVTAICQAWDTCALNQTIAVDDLDRKIAAAGDLIGYSPYTGQQIESRLRELINMAERCRWH